MQFLFAIDESTLANMDISKIRKLNLQLLVEQEDSKAAFARKYGVDPTFVSQILNDHRNMGEKAARTFEASLHLRSGWLDQPRTTVEDQISFKDTESESSYKAGSSVQEGPDIKGRVPLISWVIAGSFCEAIDLFEPGDAEDWIPCPVNHSDRAFALKVKGDSMTSPFPGQRSYPDGTIIFIDPDKEVTGGCRVVAKLNGEVTFKTYTEDMGRTYLRPINPSYQPLDITDLGLSICGVVIGSFMPE